jgi:acyl-coenzyme A synthetase/AMP-(fatty) acid ligase
MSWQEINHGSAGKVLLNIEIKIIDDDGNHLCPLEKGEICIKNKIPFMVRLWANSLQIPFLYLLISDISQ